MKLASSIKHKDFVQTIGTSAIRIFCFAMGAGTTALNIAKFLLYDVTILLTRLPFGNWVGICYFVAMVFILKNIVQGGEINRLLGRAIDLYITQKISVGDCFAKLQFYLWRVGLLRMTEFKIWAVMMVWNRSGVQQFVKDFTDNIISENAEKMERYVVSVVESTAVASIINALSQKLIAELTPILFEFYMKQYTESTAIVQSNLHDHGMMLNRKMAEITMQLEYLRLSQPDQFREILKTMSLSTLILNDAVVPSSSMIDIIAKWTGTFGSSASQQGRTKIENK